LYCCCLYRRAAQLKHCRARNEKELPSPKETQLAIPFPLSAAYLSCLSCSSGNAKVVNRKKTTRPNFCMATPARSLFSPGHAGPATAVPPPVAGVAQKLGRSPEELRLLHRSTLELLFTEEKIPAAVRAEVDVWLAKQPTSTKDASMVLAEQVRRQNERGELPWLPKEESAMRSINRFHEDYIADPRAALAELQNSYVAKAKNGTLGPVDALVGQYCLYGTDKEYSTYLLMAILLRLPSSARVPTHNWLVASGFARATTEAYGAAIAVLPTPLYPAEAPLKAQNEALLDQYMPSTAPHSGLGVKGAGVTTSDLSTLADLTGAGTLPVALQPDGSYGVDVTVVEVACNNLQQQINTLIAQKRALRQQQNQQEGHGRGRGRGGEPQTTHAPTLPPPAFPMPAPHLPALAPYPTGVKN